MHILLIISGSVAAYKAAELAREATKQGHVVTTILTKSAEKFITPLQISSLTGQQTYTDLWSLTDEVEMGHIELSRIADVVLVAPATADIIAKMAIGICDDLATTCLLASNKPIFVAPAMNVEMWNKPATQRNILQLENDGVTIVDPAEGELACGEVGTGKMAEPDVILESLLAISGI